MPNEEQRGVCANCGEPIIWYFDRDDDAQPLEHGFWYHAENMTEDCDAEDDAFHVLSE